MDATVLTCPECGCDASGRRAFRRRVRTRWAMLGLVMLMVAPSVGRVPLAWRAKGFYNPQRRGLAALVPTTPLVFMQWMQPDELYSAWATDAPSDPLTSDLIYRMKARTIELDRWHATAIAAVMQGCRGPSRPNAAARQHVRVIDVSELSRDEWANQMFVCGNALLGREPQNDYLDSSDAWFICSNATWFLQKVVDPQEWEDNGGIARGDRLFRDHVVIEGSPELADRCERVLDGVIAATGLPVEIPGSDGSCLVSVKIANADSHLARFILHLTSRSIRDAIDHEHVRAEVHSVGSRIVVTCHRDDADSVMRLVATNRHSAESVALAEGVPPPGVPWP
ncbi:MAG: hypothetical protein RBS39_02725 [Phycisphaerales bacterium]|nr:hypothetical protein [Phycisphaerales bacterium]